MSDIKPQFSERCRNLEVSWIWTLFHVYTALFSQFWPLWRLFCSAGDNVASWSSFFGPLAQPNLRTAARNGGWQRGICICFWPPVDGSWHIIWAAGLAGEADRLDAVAVKIMCSDNKCNLIMILLVQQGDSSSWNRRKPGSEFTEQQALGFWKSFLKSIFALFFPGVIRSLQQGVWLPWSILILLNVQLLCASPNGEVNMEAKNELSDSPHDGCFCLSSFVWHLVQAISTAAAARVQPLNQQETAEAGQAFLKRLAEILAGAGKEVIAAACTTASALTTLEGSLRSTIAGWRHVDPCSGA